MDEIIEKIKQNQVVLKSLREEASGALGAYLMEVNETIQIIRYDNEKLMNQLLEIYDDEREILQPITSEEFDFIVKSLDKLEEVIFNGK